MDVILAMDLMNGVVVHGLKGMRNSYRPLDWGLSPTADPVGYVRHLHPRYLYIADLDRIGGRGSHDEVIQACAALVQHTWLDRGCRTPADCLDQPHITDVVGTETAGNLSAYPGGYLSLDIQEGRVLPLRTDPAFMLAGLAEMAFDGAILLNLSAVGTRSLPDETTLRSWRDACDRPLLYGGGVAGMADLALLRDLGYQGVILATALHHGAVPLPLVQEGCLC